MTNGGSVLCGVWMARTRSKLLITTEEPNMTKLLDEIHPGEVLKEDFMVPMGITTRQLSADLDVTSSRISEIVNGKRAISAETALRLGLFFKMEPRFWLNLQAEYDMRMAERELREQIAPRIRAFIPATA
jgi:addiction module HigA family antidote